MLHYITEPDTKLWAFSKELSLEDNITVLLGKMAIYRQAGKLDETTLDLYTEYLVNSDLGAFQVAMAMLATRPREEGQTAFPSLGDIVDAMYMARVFWPYLLEGTTELLTDPIYSEPQTRRLK